jgi:serine/threonine protein kinase
MDVRQFCLHCMAIKGEKPVCPSCGIDHRMLSNDGQALPMGTILQGKYLIGHLLGAGGFGNTYLAFDLVLSQKLAIKEFLPQGLATRVQQQTDVVVFKGEGAERFRHGMDKFLEEARVLAMFQEHPGIVSVRDFFHANKTAYIVMEYVDGVTLKEFVKRKGGRIAATEAIEIMTPVMDALREVHDVGMLHRDVSPDNIYITKSKQVKLLDFGASRHLLGDASRSMSVILKPGFAPSEQYSSRGKQGPWTDVYAVAATFYTVVTGVIPEDAMVRIEEDTLQSLGQLLPDVQQSVERAVMKGLAVRTSERWQSMADFQQVLLGQLVTVESSGEQLSSDTNQSDEKRRRFGRWKLAMILFACMLAIGGATIFYLYPSKAKVEMGDYVQFGKYDNQPILWRVIHFEDENTTMLFSDKVLTLKEFDSAGDNHVNPDLDRSGRGSNNYFYSNLRQWLNSSDNLIKWTQNEPSYANENGFLADGNFTAQERKLIKPRTHKVILASVDKEQKDGGSEEHKFNDSFNNVEQNYDKSWYRSIKDQIFLLSVKDLQDYVFSNPSIPEKDYHFGYPAARLAKKDSNDALQASKSHFYWLNSPLAEYSYDVRSVGAVGFVDYDSAYNGASGVRPALLLNLSSAIFTSEGDGSKQKPHVVQAK